MGDNVAEKYMTEIKMREITVWLLSLREIPEDVFAEMFACCDGWRKEKMSGRMREQKRKQSTGAGYLLYLFRKRFSIESEIVVLPEGKPVFKKDTGFYFSISHSGDYAALAFGKQELGLDIECVGKIREQVAKRFFLKEEYDFIMEQEGKERESAFFQIWTGKEAVGKADGGGLHVPIDSFSVLSENIVLKGRHYTLCQRVLHQDNRKLWISVAW